MRFGALVSRLAAVLAAVAVIFGIFALIGWLIGSEIPLQDLFRLAEEGKIEKAVVTDKMVSATRKEGGFRERMVRASVSPPHRRETVAQRLRQHGVEVPEPGPWWHYLGIPLFYIVLMIQWRIRNPHFFLSVASTAVYVFALWIWHESVPMPSEVSGYTSLPSLRFKIFESGWIPFAILGAFLAGLDYLLQLWRLQMIPLSESAPENVKIFEAAKSGDDEALAEAADEHGIGNFYSRLLVKVRERFDRDSDLSAVISYKNELLEIEEEKISLGFVAVRWCEVVLPLLGFLGTVVGVGGAIESVATGIRTLFKGQPMETALDDLNRGFQGLGLAFDTTFLGLAGVIAIGVLHMAIKKGLALRLAAARDLLTDMVYRWSAESSVVVALGGIGGQLRLSEGRLLALEDAVRSSDRTATEFRETAQLLITQVIREDPQFQSIRKVLFRPVVVFERVGTSLFDGTRDFLNERLGSGWKLRALGVSAAEGGVLSVQSRRGEAWLLPFGIDGPQQDSFRSITAPLGEIQPVEDARSLLGITDGGGPRHLQWLSLNGPDGKAEETPLGSDPCRNEDRILPVFIQSHLRALVLRGVPNSMLVQASLSNGGSLVPLSRLPDSFEWKHFATHAESGTLFACGAPHQDGRSQLLVARLVEISAEEGKSAARAKRPKAPRIDFATLDGRVDLPRDLVPRQIVPLAQDMAVILDEDGRLFYWEKELPEPRLLRSSEWQASKSCLVRAGRGGWIAVVQNEELSMWQVQRGGWLHRYDQTPASHTVGGALPDSFRVTLDGRYLFAIREDAIFTWSFPQYTGDKN